MGHCKMKGLSPKTCKRGASWNVGEAGNCCGSTCLILHKMQIFMFVLKEIPLLRCL